MKNHRKLFIAIVFLLLLLITSCGEDLPEPEYIGNKFDQLPCPGLPVVIYHGHEYPTVLIGEQCWLQENLNVGQMINGSKQPTNNDTIEKFCFDNDPTLCDLYGGLYEWDEIMQYSNFPGTKGICPAGWHIPTREDLNTLKEVTYESSNFLKQIVSLWAPQNSYDGRGNPIYFWPTGFNATPTGFKDSIPNIFDDDEFGYGETYFWLSQETSASSAECLYLYGNSSQYSFPSMSKKFAFSVRCIKND